MAKEFIPIFPKEQKLFTAFGERIRLARLARLRRRSSTATMATRASCSRMTLHKAELGSPTVAFGTYVRILAALHLIDDIDLLAKDDELGRRLQDLGIKTSKKRVNRPNIQVREVSEV